MFAVAHMTDLANSMKKWSKWLLFPLALAIAAEASLFWVASTFGKSPGEMSLNEPAALWLTWHLPVTLVTLVLGLDQRAASTVALGLAAGTLQFFAVFWLAIAIGRWMKRGIQRVIHDAHETC